MAATQLPVGVKKQAYRDTTWHVAMDAGFDDLNTRLTLSGSTSPEGVITGYWKGQRYFDTLRIAWWVFNGTLNANTGWVREMAQGVIQMWSGAVASIPAGWVLCNGVLHAPTGYTPPNLQGRFIAGYDPADADYNAIGDVGGEKAHVLTLAETPVHSHAGSSPTATQIPTGGAMPTYNQGSSANHVAAGGNTAVSSITDMPQHTHAVTIVPEGGGAAHENRPPFYTLAYIAKL